MQTVTTPNELPTVFILYGGTGDLAKRMVLPAFYELFTRELLPEKWKLVGNGRGDVAHEDFRAHVWESLTEFAEKPEPSDWERFAGNITFAGGGFDEDDPGSLLDMIAEAKDEVGADVQLVHYLAIPPVAFEGLTKAIKAHDLADGSRVVYEKPYGTSPNDFEELDALVHTIFDEEQVYRIDHFLGKEATQNLHFTRFANTLFAEVWSRDHIAQVQIDVPETLDVADRAEFYEATGAALDMLVTHLFQVAAEVAMEPPTAMDATALQSARESVISAFRPLDPGETVLGQYRSYRATEGVADDSTTDTFVAATLWIDTDRWRGVPFLLRTGKKMKISAQRVSLIFKPAVGPIKSITNGTNVLAFDLTGPGAIEIAMVVKKPGPDAVPAESCSVLKLENVPASEPLAPYTSLLHDVLLGDRSLFTSSAGLAAAWKAFEPLLGENRPEPIGYDDDGWGPAEADKLTGEQGWQLSS